MLWNCNQISDNRNITFTPVKVTELHALHFSEHPAKPQLLSKVAIHNEILFYLLFNKLNYLK